jgi:hypothetical protein
LNNRYLFFFAIIAFILVTGVLAQLGFSSAAISAGIAAVVTAIGLMAEIDGTFAK